MHRAISAAIAVMSLALVLSGPAAAQEAGALKLELNALQPSEKGCRMTFVMTNGLGTELSEAAFEVALFDKSGAVDRLTALDFSGLPAGKTKVARFDISGAQCGAIGRVLVNSATKCAGQGLDLAVCTRKLETANRTAAEFGL